MDAGTGQPLTFKRGLALVVDDERFIVEVIEEGLRGAGFEVHTAASGEEALDLIASQGYDVALMDIHMPGISGLDVLLQLVGSHPYTAAIMVTGDSDAKVAVGAMRMGADDYIIKPFSLADLTDKVSKVRKQRDIKMQEMDRQQRLEETLNEEQVRSRELFKETIQSLAREHSLVYAQGSGKRGGHQPSTLDFLPTELRTPARSAQEFADALYRVIKRNPMMSTG